MLQTENKTPFATRLSLFPDEDGVDTVYPIIKATFELRDGVRLAETQRPLVDADKYLGEPNQSSLLYASEALPVKPATDVLLIGHAYAPRGNPITQIDVSLSVGNKKKTVRVFGDRHWKDGFFGSTFSNPVPFEKIPLIYERAYGGDDVTRNGDPTAYAYNPIGLGYRHPKGTKVVKGMPLPNLEDPRKLISSPQDSPLPAGLGPVCPNWQPRLQYVGTYDEAWQKKRAPYLPKDFDVRFYNVAPEDQTFEPYLRGGEEVNVENATPDRPLQFRLPTIEFDVILRIAGNPQPVVMNLDTVCIEPDESRLTMIWRGKQQCDKKMLKIEIARFTIKTTDHNVKGL